MEIVLFIVFVLIGPILLFVLAAALLFPRLPTWKATIIGFGFSLILLPAMYGAAVLVDRFLAQPSIIDYMPMILAILVGGLFYDAGIENEIAIIIICIIIFGIVPGLIGLMLDQRRYRSEKKEETKGS